MSYIDTVDTDRIREALDAFNKQLPLAAEHRIAIDLAVSRYLDIRQEDYDRVIDQATKRLEALREDSDV